MFTKNVLTSSIQGAGFELEYLVIAGGGGGGRSVGGGAGAGGYRSSVTGEDSGGGSSAESPLVANLGVAYTLTIGAGGTGEPSGGGGATAGGNSVFAAVESTGGGEGAQFGSAGATGGSGSGAAGGTTLLLGGSGTANQGFSGGNNNPSTTTGQRNAGGGGGAAVAGSVGLSTSGGDGGDGVQSAITGVNTYRAGGGGGGADRSVSTTGGTGGLGGGGDGGDGANAPVAGGDGVANTGGGGGGGNASANISGEGAGGNGGSGVVIIKVPRKIIAEFSAGVVYNYFPVDGFHVYEITAAGVSDTVTFKDGSDIPVTIDESLRFNDDDNAYLSRTPASAGNRKTWTWSGWVKRGNLGGTQAFLAGSDGASNSDAVYTTSDTIAYFQAGVGTVRASSAVFRDSSAWYHLVAVSDTSNTVAQNRFRLYVNGLEVTDWSTNVTITLNRDGHINSNTTQRIANNISTQLFDGYLADVYFIDGQALDPSNFGHADDNGVWQPIAYPGTYGTNGFHLEFADNSTAAALGTDTSGNGNDWTPSGITTDDQVLDTPSVNWATINPLAFGGTGVTLSDGNLAFTNAVGNSGRAYSTFEFNTGKWYCEVTVTGGSRTDIGFFGVSNRVTGDYAVYYGLTGNKFINGVQTAYGAAYGLNDVVGIAYDADTGDITFYKNGASQGVFSTGLAGETIAFYFGDGSSKNSFSGITNFGQRPFAYTPPTGFVALSTANLPTPTIADGKEHFDIALYTGTGKARTVRGFEFQPDFVWIKQRSGTAYHQLVDAIRGVDKYLFSNATNAEETRTTSITALNSNGFTLGDHGSVNGLNSTFVAWNWNAGGSTATNTDGTITSQVRANTDAGFSVLTYTADGSTSNGVGHGLDETPTVIIYKRRSGAASGWYVWTTVIDGSNDVLILNTTAAATDITGYGSPTSTTISNYGYPNTAEIVAYCFHSVDGFSKFGSYTGNGSTDGPFIYTGFRPAFVLVKRTDVANDWDIRDTSREPYNYTNKILFPNRSDAEATNAALHIDINSNGFKVRGTGNQNNASGGTYIYMAFAENPFKTARAR